MKILFIAKLARHQLPLEQVLAILKNTKEWQDQRLKDGTYDCIHNFIDGGGIGIANVDSLEAAYDLLLDYPARPIFDWEVHPLCESGYGISKSISRLEKAVEQQ